MQIHYATVDSCQAAAGVVVVIDVCRAFSTAAYAFGAGAGRILLAGTVEEALALRERFPGALVMGEAGGLPVEGFDLWNSPTQVSGLDLAGRTLVQRTSAGTQGMVRSTGAQHLLGGSFAVAGATVRTIQRLWPDSVTFVITGQYSEEPDIGIEDRACADYMAALLRGDQPDAQDYLGWQETFIAGHHLEKMPAPLYQRMLADVALCCVVDRFSFALPVRRMDGLLIMEKLE